MSTPPDAEPPRGNPRFPLFDSLRAIAALSVLTTHAGYLSGANLGAWYGPFTARLDIGVTVFFLISGFLLYRPFVASRLNGTPRPRIAGFARRRILRIVPAYWLALTVLSFYPGLPQMWTDHSWAYYLFAQVYVLEWSLGGLLPAWSLCVELSFYLALPFLALLVRRPSLGRFRNAKIRTELIMVAVLYAVGILFRVYVRANEGPLPNSNLYSTLPGNIDWFALGMFLAVASVALHGRERQPLPVRVITRWPSVPWAVGLVLFWVVATQMGIGPEFPQVFTDLEWIGEHVVYGAAAFCLLLPAVFGDHAGGLPRMILRNRVLSWLGLVSYGIFLWHLPVVAELGTGPARAWWGESPMLGIGGVGLLLSVACATVSYYALERPLMRWRGRPARDRRRAGAQAPTEASGIAG